MAPSPTRLVDPVHLFNAHGQSVMTHEAQFKRIQELEKALAQSQENCRTLARRLKAIAEARTPARA